MCRSDEQSTLEHQDARIMQSRPPVESLLSAKDVAKLLGVHPVTLLRWAREGRIPHHRLSARKIVFVPSEVSAWILEPERYTTPVSRTASTKRKAA